MSVTVTVRDNETGEEATAQVPDGEFFILCTNPAFVSNTQYHANGTAVLTVKGRTNPIPDLRGART